MTIEPITSTLSHSQRLRIQEALSVGGVIIYPTESSYGLGADWRNASAVEYIAKLKYRPHEKAFSVLVSSIRMARQYCHWTPLAQQLAKAFWPGALTMVLPLRNPLPGQTTLALRVSSNPIAQRIVSDLNAPLVATSTNRSGRPACYSLEEFEQQFKHEKLASTPTLFLNAGTLPRHKPSTIIRIQDNRVEIIRSGAISHRSLQKIIADPSIIFTK